MIYTLAELTLMGRVPIGCTKKVTTLRRMLERYGEVQSIQTLRSKLNAHEEMDEPLHLTVGKKFFIVEFYNPLPND